MNKQPYDIIKIDKYTKKIQMPNLLLMTRSFDVIGKISNYTNWNLSLVGNGIDEISFEVNKYVNGELCPIWDDLIDLKIVDVTSFGRFEISVNYTDNSQTVKSVHGVSLETELAQIPLYEFHINDDDAMTMEITDYNKDDFDEHGNFIPTVFYREILLNDTPEEAEKKRKHSLLHRVLADKAPHWHIGSITPYITLSEDEQPESAEAFQRTYTCDGTTIYDFLTGEVAKESNVIFTFDTINREINCYSLCDCIDQETGEVLCNGIGEDTNILVSKNKLANEITISSNKDNVKNCFRIEGGDDVITDMVRVVNMNGSNYIYQFADFQYNDMPEELKNKIIAYQNQISSMESQDKYYGYGNMSDFINGTLTLFVTSELEAATVLNICKNNKIVTNNTKISDYADTPYWYIVPSNNAKELYLSKTQKSPYKSVEDAFNTMGIYTRLCEKYDELSYFESSMMPEVVISETTAEEQYQIMVNELQNMTVGVSSLNHYNDNLFVGVSNNIEAMANILIDARYNAAVIKDSASFSKNEKGEYIWTGNIQIIGKVDDTDYYPKNNTKAYQNTIKIKISDDELTFTKQKIQKALSKGSMLDIDFDIDEIWNDSALTSEKKSEKIRDYFNLYSLNRLKSFYDGYNSCLSILMSLPDTSSARQELYNKYYHIMQIISNPPTSESPNPVSGVLDIRQAQVNTINADIKKITEEQKEFQEDENYNFQKYLGDDLYTEFCKYRREDSYTNSNYISDGLSTSECLAKAKELVETATKEAKKACVLQRTVSTSLNNLFALPEFEQLYDKFALFNYIRIRTEDEILKLRLIGVEFNGDSVSDIHVTFSEQIESIDGKTDDLTSIIQQAGNMATSFPSTALQAKKGASANNIVSEIYNAGLNASKAMLTNNDSNEVTVTSSGIICKRMDDEGYYGDKQLRITGNMLAFTKDAWKNVSLAIGETTFKNPITNETENAYGIIAENIVGKLTLSEQLGIYNDSGSLTFDNNGFAVTNGINSVVIKPNTTNIIQVTKRNNDEDELVLYADNYGYLHVKGIIEIDNGSTIQVTDKDGNIFYQDIGEFINITAHEITTDLLDASSANIENAILNNIDARYTTTEELNSNYATIERLESNYATIEKLEADYATIENLNASNARISTLETNSLTANSAEIRNLQSEIADIDTLIFGSATGTTIQTEFANAVIAMLGNAQIKDAMIDKISADRINSGTLNTNNITIQSDNGNLIISDNTIQINDNIRTRVQLGKDAGNDYSINIWDANGNLMFSQGGITADAIKNAIIRDDMISDNANISAGKLDISSLFNVINNDTSHTLNSTKIYLDDESQTLDVAFKSITSEIDNVSETVISQGTEISTIQGQIESKIWEQDIKLATDELGGEISELSTQYSTLSQNLDGFKSEVNKTYVTSSELATTTNDIQVQLDNNYSDLKNQIDSNIDNLQGQIDGAIQTFTGSEIPVLSNYPANAWIDDEIKNQHIGDLYYVQTEGDNQGFCYRFQLNNTEYEWVLLKDSEITKAIQEATEAMAKATGIETTLVNDYSTTSQMNSAIEESASSIKLSVSEIYTTKVDFDNLEIGGRNYFKNSDFTNATKYWGGINGAQISTSIIDDKLTLTATKGTSDYLFAQNPIPLHYTAGDTIKMCISADFYSNEIGTVDIGAWVDLDGWHNITTDVNYVSQKLVGGWMHFEAILTLYSASYSGMVIVGFRTNVTTVYMYHPKAELGNKSTDWTLAPEDVSNAIDNAESNAISDTTERLKSYSTTEEMNSAISVAKDSITSEVSKTYTTKTEFENLEIGGRNLYIIKNSEAGYIEATVGNIQSLSATRKERTSEFIPVIAGENLIMQVWVTPTPASTNEYLWMAYAFYDDEMSYLNSRPSKTGGQIQANGQTYNIYSITVPPNAAYIRVSARTYDDGLIMLEKATKPSAYSIAPEDVEADIAQVKSIAEQTAEGFSWLVADDYSESNITLSKDAYDVIAENITLSGNHITLDADTTIGSNFLLSATHLQLGEKINIEQIDEENLKDAKSNTIYFDNTKGMYYTTYTITKASDGYSYPQDHTYFVYNKVIEENKDVNIEFSADIDTEFVSSTSNNIISENYDEYVSWQIVMIAYTDTALTNLQKVLTQEVAQFSKSLKYSNYKGFSIYIKPYLTSEGDSVLSTDETITFKIYFKNYKITTNTDYSEGDMSIYGTLNTSGNTTINGTASIAGKVIANNGLSVKKGVDITGDTTIKNLLNVGGVSDTTIKKGIVTNGIITTGGINKFQDTSHGGAYISDYGSLFLTRVDGSIPYQRMYNDDSYVQISYKEDTDYNNYQWLNLSPRVWVSGDINGSGI